MLELFYFVENPQHLWTGVPRVINPGDGRVQEPVDTPTSLYDVLWTNAGGNLTFTYTNWFPRYTDHAVTRRLRSASENARPNTTDYAPSDLGAFVMARAVMDEYSELLRPADAMAVSLQAGPTHNMVYYPFIGVTLHHWGYVPHPVVERLANGRMRITYPNPPTWEDSPTFADGTWITHAGAYPLWRERPRHYHQEMGHSIAEDHDRATRPALPPLGTKLAPDTFLVASGFRCAR